MTRDNKSIRLLLMVTILVSFVVFTVLYLMRESAFREQALFWILWVSCALFVLVIIFFAVAQLWQRLSKFTWVSEIPTALLIYFGVLIISLGSFYKDLLKDIHWDPSMIALGIAIIAFGLGLFTYGKSVVSVSNLDKKVLAMSEKLDGLSNAIDVSLEESKKLAKRLTEPQKEDKGKDN